MSEGPYIFEVSKKGFDELVLFNSHKLPVVVEFMGVWSEPCINLEYRFSDLAKELPEQFIFAKVDIDEQQELRETWKVENIPTTLVFRNGELKRTEVGELGDADVRALLKDFDVFRQSDQERDEARQLHLSGDTPSAIIKLTQAIRSDPSNTRIALDMVQIFIDIDEIDQARGLFERLPQTDRECDFGKVLNGQLLFLGLAAKTAGIEKLQQILEQNPADHQARFDYAICLVAKRNYTDALENLLRILEQEPDFREGGARELMVTILNMLLPSDPELVQEYRRKLGNMLAG
jgi:putative thioredoxin